MNGIYGYYSRAGFVRLDPFSFGHMLAMCSSYGLSLPNDEAHSLIWESHDDHGEPVTISVDLTMSSCTHHNRETRAHFDIRNSNNHVRICEISTVIQPMHATVTVQDGTGRSTRTWILEPITVREGG